MKSIKPFQNILLPNKYSLLNTSNESQKKLGETDCHHDGHEIRFAVPVLITVCLFDII